MLRQDKTRTTPNDHSGGMPQNKALAPLRTQPFLKEPSRDGNTIVMLPDQTVDETARREQQTATIATKIASFEQKFGK
ncbi:hypothetical protein J7T55_015576 [Diaporthe amygdali]|uniref:uncharacterized protein n=1 Tax=Phomopsis amygdali TaxID=1214568 RepID=UPI0022FF1B39|nr:uncharacterized protein J7T55_015576 [Diaporthe amygdali]KAJ0120841.1 hypothetical protein J7T55_015576 [Diaporthe amygdali]